MNQYFPYLDKRVRLLALLSVFVVMTACSFGNSSDDDNDSTEHSGQLLLPMGADSETEYPASIHVRYSDDCTETEPDPIYTDDEGYYDEISFNCGDDDGNAFLVMASRTGQYGLMINTENIDDSGLNDTYNPELVAVRDVKATVTVATGYFDVVERIDVEFGIGVSFYEFVSLGSLFNVDGVAIFTDLSRNLTEAGVVTFSGIPEMDQASGSGGMLAIYGDLLVEVGGSDEPLSDEIEVERFSIEDTGLTEVTVAFENDLSLVERQYYFTTNGEFDSNRFYPTYAHPYWVRLSDVPGRQSVLHILPMFTKNISFQIDGVDVTSGTLYDVDLGEAKTSRDIVFDITNVVTAETSSTTYTISAEGLGTNTNLLVDYRVESDERGVYLGDIYFQPRVYHDEYSLGVDHSVDEIDLTLSPDDELATILINGVEYSDYEEYTDYTTLQSRVRTSATLNIAPGANDFDIEVVAEDTTVVDEYSFDVFRGEVDDADIETLQVHESRGDGAWSPIDLSPEFDRDTFSYSVSVAGERMRLYASPRVNASRITVRVNGVMTVDSSVQVLTYPTLEPGLNTIELDVLATDGTTRQTYTIEVTRTDGGTDGGGDTDECIPNSDLPCDLPL